MAYSDVFPRNNLPPDAVPWGRTMEDRARQNAYQLENLRLAMLSENRAGAGQMGVVGRNLDVIGAQQSSIQAQVDELGSRSSGTASASNLSISVSSTTSWASGTRDITVPGESGGTRTNVLSFRAEYGSSSSTVSGTAFLKITSGSLTLFTTPLNTDSGKPSSWVDLAQGSFVAPVSSGGTTFTITMYGQNFSSGSRTLTLSNITMAYVRADRV